MSTQITLFNTIVPSTEKAHKTRTVQIAAKETTLSALPLFIPVSDEPQQFISSQKKKKDYYYYSILDAATQAAIKATKTKSFRKSINQYQL